MTDCLALFDSMFTKASRVTCDIFKEINPATNTNMTLHISGRGCQDYLVYRFDPDGDTDLFPFYQKKGPKYLRSICDYFLFVDFNNRVYCLAIELKSSSSGASQQLQASAILLEYFIKTARRINSSIQEPSIVKVRVVGGKSKTTIGPPSYEHSSDYISYRWSNCFDIKSVLDAFLEKRTSP